LRQKCHFDTFAAQKTSALANFTVEQNVSAD